MNREIKFRVWNKDGNKWVKNLTYCIDDFSTTNKEWHIVMQYTGLKDKNGKEIYEGDILRYSDGSDVSTHKIFWDDKAARFYDIRLEDGDSATSYDDFEFFTEAKVIGNIYENPELLKQSEI